MIIVASVLFNYACSRIIKRKRQNGCVKWITAFGILANVSVIFYFKYFNFSIDSINWVLNKTGTGFINSHLDLLLPVGISFYTFQAISYLQHMFAGTTSYYTVISFLSMKVIAAFVPGVLFAGFLQRPLGKFYDKIKSNLFVMACDLFVQICVLILSIFMMVSGK